MNDWVVLGRGSPVRTFARRLGEQERTVHAVTADGRTAERASEAGVEVCEGEPTDRETLATLTGVSGVLVATGDPEDALAMLRAARAAYPEAVVVAYLDPTGQGEDDAWSAVREAADDAVDPGRATAASVLQRVGDEGTWMRRLRRVLTDIDRLAVVTHDNPDPDAIASAVALQRIAVACGCAADVCYYGEITHQENRAFVNLLDFELTALDAGTTPAGDGVALVDHSRAGANDGLPADTSVDVVIDHHPPRAPVEARFVDLRSGVGATSTLLTGYLEQFGIGLETAVATGLLFGIRVDTQGFTREACARDFEMAARLLPQADLGMLERIESPSVSPETVDTIGAAITNRRRRGSVLLSCVGELTERSALAQAADRLVGLDDVTVAVVYGVSDQSIYLSARAQGATVDLGEVLREAFGEIGSAGGHADMAGAQVALGIFDSVEDRETSLVEVVESVVEGRFFQALRADTARPDGESGFAYTTGEHRPDDG